ncbi:HAMP domain-containing histidine kinase [Shewanella sp. KX20019]|uniref:sensor histidine kinase n=1 Tax=Shewanella sp. KX20019 TaxID=2803864 RepID=UPI00192675DF|nr:HAMP domain-containing sensor histidine kinase [Shewanella sp. KX20019]QQX78756.1 HAMP domain-containing histidine kinase [Shewanella sp. KX20019]
MKLRKSLTLVLMFSIILILVVLILSYTLWARENYFRALDTSLTFNMIKAEQIIAEKGIDAIESYLEIIETRVIQSYEQLPNIITQQYPREALEVGSYVNSESNHLIFEDLGLTSPVSIDNDLGYYVYTAQKYNGSIYYLVVEYQSEIPSYWQIAESQLDQIWKASLLVILALILTIWGMFLHIAKPIHRLNLWAQHLSRDDLSRPVPSFEYRELDSLATKIHQSLQEVDAASQRESQFLQYASHELRTPISIIKSNAELLEQLLVEPPAATQSALQRLSRAGKNMHQLTETLLWLTRKEISTPEPTLFSLTQLLVDSVEQHSYLLMGKKVAIEQSLVEANIHCPRVLMNIVVANLIRNAMQHIDEGKIRINLNQAQLVIENEGLLLENDKADGFGLGLKLVKQISEKLDWNFNIATKPNKYISTIKFR